MVGAQSLASLCVCAAALALSVLTDHFNGVWLASIGIPAGMNLALLAARNERRTALFRQLPFGYLGYTVLLWAYATLALPVASPLRTVLLLGVLLFTPFVFTMVFFLAPSRLALWTCAASAGAMAALALVPRGPADPFAGPTLPVMIVMADALLVGSLYFFARLEPRLQHAWRRAHDLETLASLDPLTGVANRRGLEVGLAWLTAKEPDAPLALLLFDIDRFKDLNDRHGHAVGDQVLVLVARRLQQSVREGDLVARWGGEEFVVVAPGATLEVARQLAERLRRHAMAPRPTLTGLSLTWPTLSCGVAVVPARRAKDGLREADEALYRAKAAGRDRVELKAANA